MDMNRRQVSGVLPATVLLVLVAMPPTATSAPFDWSLAEYIHTEWTHHDGLPLTQPRVIRQTTDGYLWILGTGYIVRFDGLRFVPMRFPCDSRVADADAAPDGTLWFRCGGGLFRRTARGEIVEVPQTILQPLRGGGFRVDSRGRLWFVGYSSRDRYVGYRVEPDGSRVTQFYDRGDRGIMSWTEDSEGAIWYTTLKELLRFHNDQIETVPIEGVLGLTRAPSGGVFACSENMVWHVRAGSRQILARAPQGVAFACFSESMSAASDGRVWIGTRHHGIALIHPDGRTELLPGTNPMGGFVSTVFMDREETVWVGAVSGLHRFRKPRARVLSSLVRQLSGIPQYAFVDSRDELWLKSGTTLLGTKLATDARRNIEGNDYVAMAEDGTGRLWLASDSDIGYLAGNRFEPVRDQTGVPVRQVYSLQRDNQGDVWALSKDVGLYRVTPGPPRLVLPEPRTGYDFLVSSRQGQWLALNDSSARGLVLQHIEGHNPVVHNLAALLPRVAVMSFAEDDESIWIGAFGGLFRWRNGTWTMWTREHGLPGGGDVSEVMIDRFDHIWLMTREALVAVPRAQLDSTPDGAPRRLTFTRIGELDRVIPHPGDMRSSPRASASRDGQIYFTTFDSVAVVNPSAVDESSLQPRILIESVAADRQPVDLATSAPRFVEPSLLEFEYTSLSLRSPENIRFRYKLEGYDADWIDADGRRQATYGALTPGTYRFRVIGTGSEGGWNEEGATFAFQIAPVFWHTWWFGASLMGLVAIALLSVHRLRVRQVRRQLSARFEAQLAERTRIAQNLHDTLLQSAYAALLHAEMADDVLTDAAPSTPAVDPALPPLKRAVRVLSELNAEGRATVHGLRALSIPTDLTDALTRAAQEQRNQHNVDFGVNLSGATRTLHPPVRDEVYWIAREALVNAYQHANPQRVDVDLAYTRGWFRCVIRDDGCGIETNVLTRGREGHWGLPGMRERAERIGAQLRVRSVPGSGTEVELRVKGRLAYAGERPGDRVRQWLKRRPVTPESS